MEQTYYDNVEEYYHLLLKKYLDGRLSEDKFKRLRDKLGEWTAHAEQNE